MRRTWPTLLSVTLVVLVLAALALPALLPRWILERYRHEVADLGRYRGDAGAVQMSFVPPGYRLRGVRFSRRDADAGDDLLQADLHVRLHPLRGASEVRVEALRMHLVDGGTARASQLGEGITWRRLLDALVPKSLPVQRVTLDDAALTMRVARAPDAAIVLAPLQATLDGLQHHADARVPMPARVTARGQLLGHAPLSLRMQFDPQGPMRRMQVQVDISALALARLDPWAEAWGGIDFERGHADARLGFGSVGAQLNGVLALSLRDVDVFDAGRDLRRDRDGPLRAMRELLAGAAVQLRARGGELQLERPLQARIELPDDNLEGLVLALVEGLRALDAD